MRKVITYIRIFIISTLFVSCSSYQLASYYIDNDGIYVSNERGIDYEVVFKDFADESLLANSHLLKVILEIYHGEQILTLEKL